MADPQFEELSRTRWDAAIDQILVSGAIRAEWCDPAAIAGALSPILGESSNHAMLPTGGGQDIGAVRLSESEPGCLELKVSRGSAYLVMPRKLTAERITGAPGNSFLLLELDELPLTDVYEDDPEDVEEFGMGRRGRTLERGQEEVVEIAPGQYVEVEVLDRGYLGYDEDGSEMPLPDGARRVVRFLRGKVLFVAKASMWNQERSTYDGRHSEMSVDQIRLIIERSIEAAA
jgi:hypothetical protein